MSKFKKSNNIEKLDALLKPNPDSTVSIKKEEVLNKDTSNNLKKEQKFENNLYEEKKEEIMFNNESDENDLRSFNIYIKSQRLIENSKLMSQKRQEVVSIRISKETQLLLKNLTKSTKLSQADIFTLLLEKFNREFE